MADMTNFLAIYESSGLVRQCVHEPGDDYIEMCIDRGIPHLLVEGSPPQDIHTGWYVRDDALVSRPVISSIADLPIPCIVKIDGEPVTVDDGSLEFEGGSPGAYKIEIDHWPYMPFQTEVVVK